MELALPVVLLVLGLVVGVLIARMLLRSREEQAVNSARLEVQSEVAQLQSEIAVLQSRLHSVEVRAQEQNAEVQIRGQRIEALTRELHAESAARAGLETEVRLIPELQSRILAREQELETLRDSLRVEIDNRSQFEAKAKRIPELERLIAAADKEMREGNQRIADLRAQLAEVQTAQEKEGESMDEKIVLLQEAEKRLSDAFHAVSAKALQSNNQSFLELAKSTLENFQQAAKGDLEKRQQSIHELVKPVRESLEKVDQKILELEKQRVGAYHSLTEQVKMLSESQQSLRSETANLVKALRAPQTRGRWGEIQLRRVVEMAGMLEYCDFFEQRTDETSNGTIRPDMEIKLPGDKSIIVDAKVALQAYLEAIESQDDIARKQKMRDHARQVRTHVQTLSSKKYWDTLKQTPEFVVLFLSGESLLYAALEEDPQLIEYGIGEKVIIATPTTLIALLKSASYGWRQENLAKNAKSISELGSDLYRRISKVGDHLAKLGDNLERSVRSYNETVGSLERNVLPGARRFKELGVSTGDKEIEELPQIEIGTRTVQAPELVASGSELPPSLPPTEELTQPEKLPGAPLFE